MKPRLIVPAEEVHALRTEAAERRIKAVAWEFRGESVFHLRLLEPKVIPSGWPVPAKVWTVASAFDLAREADALVRDIEGIPEGIALIVARRGEAATARAFIARENRWEEAELLLAPAGEALFSRYKGLIRADALQQRHVCLIGLGSFGGNIAIDLAKAGVGRFTLIDPDRLEVENLVRHVCGYNDLGRYKTHAVRTALWDKNRDVEVTTHELDVNQHVPLLRETVAAADLTICVTDENRSRFLVNETALAARKTALFGRAITRAAGGDVFRLRPEKGPCLACLFGQGFFAKSEEVGNIRQARRDAPAYTSEADAERAVHAGLAADIAPLTNFITKLALSELLGGSEPAMANLAEDFSADFYIWANRRDHLYADWSPMEYRFDRGSILRWYGVRVERDPQCLTCGASG